MTLLRSTAHCRHVAPAALHRDGTQISAEPLRDCHIAYEQVRCLKEEEGKEEEGTRTLTHPHPESHSDGHTHTRADAGEACGG